MSIVVEQSHGSFKAEDLLKPGMPEKFVEIIEGELVVMTPAGWEHNRIASNFEFLFVDFCKSHPDMLCGGDNDGFLLQRQPDVLLSPDASLFKKRPMSDRPLMNFAPSIAVEVLSPSNNPAQIAYKGSKYFEYGVEQVWIADFKKRSIEFQFPDGRCVIAKDGASLTGEGIAEGLHIDLKTIFEIPNQ